MQVEVLVGWVDLELLVLDVMLDVMLDGEQVEIVTVIVLFEKDVVVEEEAVEVVVVVLILDLVDIVLTQVLVFHLSPSLDNTKLVERV